MGDMGLHGAPGHEEAFADLGVGESLGRESGHGHLGGGEGFPAELGAPARLPGAPADTGRTQDRLDACDATMSVEELIGRQRLVEVRPALRRVSSAEEGDAEVLLGAGELEDARSGRVGLDG